MLFIDTGYKTFPAFLKALVGYKCGDQVDVHMLYHTVDEGLECLPHIFVRKANQHEKPQLPMMNDIGSYASFLKTGSTIDQSGRLRVTFGPLP